MWPLKKSRLRMKTTLIQLISTISKKKKRISSYFSPFGKILRGYHDWILEIESRISKNFLINAWTFVLVYIINCVSVVYTFYNSKELAELYHQNIHSIFRIFVHSKSSVWLPSENVHWSITVSEESRSSGVIAVKPRLNC